MKFQSRHMGGVGSYFAVSLLALAIAGCSSSSDSEDDTAGGNGAGGPVSLSEEEQVMGAALTGMSQAGMAQGYAQAQADEQSDPSGGSSGSASMGTAGFYTASGDEVELLFKCPSDEAGAEFGGEGEYRFEGDGDLIAIHNLEFPSQFKNAGSLDGQGNSDDARLRADCVVTMDGEDFFHFKGSLDVAQQENINDGRVVVARIGGFTGPSADDAPDLTEAMETAVTFDGDLSESRFRAEIYACEGCIDGDLSNFGDNPELDSLSVSFMDMIVRLQGLNAAFRAGESLANPFVMKTQATGTQGQAEVELDGLLKFEDLDTGCGFDVTYATSQALLVNEYDKEGEAETVGGKMDVTLNESGNIYTVEFQPDGDVRVFDSSGSEVTPDPSTDAQSCGFFLEGADDSTGAAELEGTFVSPCVQISGDPDPDLWAEHTYEFSGSGDVSLTLESFTNDTCSVTDQSETVEYSYSLGNDVPQADGRGDAVEIDFTSDSQSDIFDIARIESGVLYFGEPSPFSMPDSESVRPDTINTGTEWLYIKQ